MTFPTTQYETELWNKGYKYVVGIDEVGRGAWAGPVVVGAVIFSPDCILPQGINDSKLLTSSVREKLSLLIHQAALACSFGIIDVNVINTKGIGVATHMAMRQAIKNLSIQPDFHLIDAFYIKHVRRETQKPIIRGDTLSTSIAAASIIAKVFRDNLMKELATTFPQYLFDVHKGYGTKKHQQAIKQHGFCSIHRRSFDLDWLTTHD